MEGGWRTGRRGGRAGDLRGDRRPGQAGDVPCAGGARRARRAGLSGDRRGQERLGSGAVPRLRRGLAEAQRYGPESAAATKMLSLLRYVDGDLGDDATYEAMSRGGRRGRAGAVLPGGAAARCSGGSPRASPAPGRAGGARVMVEKPFGTDLASSRQLNDTMHQYFPEEAIFRVDDWLAFDPVENVLFVRFANSIIEPLLNRTYVREHPDHDGRGVRRRPTAARSTTGPAPSGTCCRTTCSRCWPRCWPSRRTGRAWHPGATPRRSW